ncbi:B-cell linker protein isoform 2-T2 [Mantella aurantiaca]
MDKITKITAPAGEKFRQLQKMVHDIKNSETGFMQKFKRITNKPPPSVPRRDYVTGPQDDETDEWSDEFARSRIANTKHQFGCQKSGLPHKNLDCRGGSDYENPDDRDETYEDPTEEQDGENYEPPPNDQEPRFTPSYKFTDKNSSYADRNRQPTSAPNDHINRPTRPLPKPNENLAKPSSTLLQLNNRLPLPSKPVPKPLPKPVVVARQHPTSLPSPVKKKPVSQPKQQQDDEDYIMPGDEEDDNYIEPTASPEPYKPPVVNRTNKPGQPPFTKSPNQKEEPDLYVVPENEVKPTPPAREVLPVPRKNSPPKQEPYVKNCDDTDRRPEPSMKPTPSPLPRNVKPKPVIPKSKTPGSFPRDVNSNIEKFPVMDRQRIHSAGTELPPTPLPPLPPTPLPPTPLPPTPPSRQKPPEITNRYVINQSRHGSVVEQDAGVLNKEWYSSSCDRKAAEEALLASSKDGSFLVRRSTGQDQKQPFTLVVFYKRRVYNIPVRYIESSQQYALGREKSGEEKFNSVAEMIENHRRSNLVLIDSQTNTKDLTKLMHAVRVL